MSSGVADEQVALIAAAVAALHEDLAVDSAWRLGEADLLGVTGSLVRLRAGVEAAYLRAVAEVDRRRRGGPAGGAGGPLLAEGPRGCRSGIGSSTESFLRTSAPLTPSQARSGVAAARALGPVGSLRELEPQLACGDITRAHVDVATRCLDRIPVHLRSDDEDRVTIARYFAALAPTRHALELKHNAAVLLERLAPEAADRFDPLCHERRFLDWTSDATGMLLGRFALDPAAGATLQAAVDAASAPAPSVAGVRDGRSARERRADALVMVADTALGLSGPVRGEKPRVVVHTTAEQLAGLTGPGGSFAGPARTDAGTRLGAGAVRRVACDAVLQRVVWDRDGRRLGSVTVDLGRTVRLADVHLRRVLAARDRACVIPGCGAQPAHFDTHHVVHWADGGPTSLGNNVLLCGSHHTAVHEGVWQIRMRPDGIPEVVPPERVDPLRRPRRASHHDVDDLLDTRRRPSPSPVRGEVDPEGTF